MTPVVVPTTLHSSDPNYTRERYSVAQAAVYLDVPVGAVYEAVGKRQIAHRRLGRGRIRFSQADLDAWRRANRIEVHTREVDRVALKRRRESVEALADLMTGERYFQ